jgi:hypothetical protein
VLLAENHGYATFNNGYIRMTETHHPVIRLIMIDFAANYDPMVWGHQGPKVRHSVHDLAYFKAHHLLVTSTVCVDYTIEDRFQLCHCSFAAFRPSFAAVPGFWPARLPLRARVPLQNQ